MSKRNVWVGISWCLEKLDTVTSVMLFVFVAPIALIACCGLYEDFEVEHSINDDIPVNAVDDTEKLQFLRDYDDARMWLMIESTSIDYPVMQAKDNSWYLSRNYAGDFSGAGSLFLDWRNQMGDDAWLIYGHSMSGERMFSELAKYADADFLAAHRWGWLWFEEAKHEVEILGYAELDANSAIVYDMEKYRNGQNAQILQLFNLENRDGRLVILSTCSRKSRKLRDVVLGLVLEK